MSAAGRGRPGRRGTEEEHVNHERWLVSYSDMITVLMGLFIVLFAMSQVDQEKYEALRESLAAGFEGTTGGSGVLDGTDGAMDSQVAGQEATSAGTPGDPAALPADLDQTLPEDRGAALAAARRESAHLAEVQADLTRALTSRGLEDTVEFRVDARGLSMALVADDVFFSAASADLTKTARRVLDTSGPTLRGLEEQISVEGHANVLPVSGRYPTNWELSADRATKVLRYLVERDGIQGTRVMAVGLGDQRPLVAGSKDEALAANRRVDLVILSSAPEAVRDLLPVVAGTES